MTLKELSQLYYLRREIEQEQRRVQYLREKATATTAGTGGMPHGGAVSDKTAIAADIADCETLIAAKIAESIVEYRRLVTYINGIEDSLTRQIFTARFVDGLRWEEVADRVGGNAGSVRMTCYRYLRRK